MSIRVGNLQQHGLAFTRQVVGEPHQLRAEQRPALVEPHREVVEDAPLPGAVGRRDVVVGDLRRAGGQLGVLCRNSMARAVAVGERAAEHVDHGAVLDQAFDDEVLAALVDMNDRDVAELAVDVADAGDGRAVVASPRTSSTSPDRNVIAPPLALL